MSEMDRIYEDISAAACELLEACVDDYASRIWEVIRQDVLADVCECTDAEECGVFADGDVALAIGRAICERLGLEV